MKSAEEWQNMFGKFPVDQKGEDEIYRMAKLPESVLPPVAFWNSVLTELDIKQIQLDALRWCELQLKSPHSAPGDMLEDLRNGKFAIRARIDELTGNHPPQNKV